MSHYAVLLGNVDSVINGYVPNYYNYSIAGLIELRFMLAAQIIAGES